MERRYVQLPATRVRLEQRSEGQPATIVGYAAVFYDEANAGTEYKFSGWWDDFAERIMPSAFDRAVKEDDVRALFNHDPNQILGRTAAGTLALSVDKTGLRYEITPPDTDQARAVVEAIRRGDLTGSSFAFTADEVVFREIKDSKTDDVTVVREIHRASLFDVGPVTYPAYEATTTGVRAAGELAEARQAFDRWKAERTAAEDEHRQRIAFRARAVEISS